MKTSPTKGGWWGKFREAVLSLPEPAPARSIDVDQMLADNTRLLEENQRLRETAATVRELRKQLADSQHHESLMARRIEAFRRKWPAIHKDFFTAERKTK